MSLKIPKRLVIVFALLSIVIILIGYFAYIEFNSRIAPTPTSSPTPTENPNAPLITNYSITIPEIYKVGFGIAEIQMKFIAPTSNLQNQQPVSEANYSTTKLPITLSTNPSDATNHTLPPIINGTTIDIKVNVYWYTLITDNPRILVASEKWTETKYI
ncbi:MAG: hypothetical protein QM398_04595 [Thermoproteota archaeon]|nr:hypothetical protein [Thermoproteota archaeon]